jgi:hypothetical protein
MGRVVSSIQSLRFAPGVGARARLTSRLTPFRGLAQTNAESERSERGETKRPASRSYWGGRSCVSRLRSAAGGRGRAGLIRRGFAPPNVGRHSSPHVGRWTNAQSESRSLDWGLFRDHQRRKMRPCTRLMPPLESNRGNGFGGYFLVGRLQACRRVRRVCPCAIRVSTADRPPPGSSGTTDGIQAKESYVDAQLAVRPASIRPWNESASPVNCGRPDCQASKRRLSDQAPVPHCYRSGRVSGGRSRAAG